MLNFTSTVKNKVTIKLPHILFMLAFFITISLIGINKAMAVEEAKYSVVVQNDKLELRQYEPHILAEVLIEGDFKEVGSQAFSPLFKYISGENKSQQKIAMTAPVSQSQSETGSQKIAMTAPVSQQQQDGKWAVSFMMPASFTLDNTPQPLNPLVKIRQVPPQFVASVRYSGSWKDESYKEHLANLTQWIKDKNYQPMGEPVWARYNSPYTPWFMRRNEILITVSDPTS